MQNVNEMKEAAEVFTNGSEVKAVDTDERMKVLTRKIFDLKQMEKYHNEELETAKDDRIIKEEELFKLLESMGIKSIKTDFGTFTRGITFRAYYHDEDRQKISDWLKSIHCESIIKQTVNANTFTAFIKERMQANTVANLPKDDGIPDFVLSFTKDKISFRKSKK